jgi:hypothetical protein
MCTTAITTASKKSVKAIQVANRNRDPGLVCTQSRSRRQQSRFHCQRRSTTAGTHGLSTYVFTRSRPCSKSESVRACSARKRTGISGLRLRREELRVNYVPEEWLHFQRTFICTHGWVPKDKANAKDSDANIQSRPRRHLRYTGCPFRFNVQLTQKTDGDWCLEVKHGLFKHNHRVDEDTFGTYPSSRGVKNPEIATRVHDMIQTRAKRSLIYDFLLQHGENVTRRDLDNMIAKHRLSVATVNDGDATAAIIAEFTQDGTGNVVTVDETPSGETGVISLTTRHMRSLYARFPEMILVDCTHQTNRYVQD